MRQAKSKTAPNFSLPVSGHWLVRIAPNKQTLTAKEIWPSLLTAQNRGPGHLLVETGGATVNELASGEMLVTFVFDHVNVQTKGKAPADFEFEIAPLMKPILMR